MGRACCLGYWETDSDGGVEKKRYQQMVDIEKSVFLQPKKIKEKY